MLAHASATAELAEPAAAPCKRRVSEGPCRIEGSPVTFAFRWEERARCKQCADTYGTGRLWRPRRTQLSIECRCACRRHQRCQCEERGFR